MTGAEWMDLTVLERKKYNDLSEALDLTGQIGEALDRSVREAARLVGVRDEQLDKSPFELSGGQQRRVAFAGVLAMEPELLVLDEPVAGLDPLSRADFLALIARFHARGMTVVMVSHSMEDLAALSDRILVLSEGRVFALGTPAQVFADAASLKAVGLGAPAPQAFASSLRDAGFSLPRELYDETSLAVDLAAQLAAGAAHAAAGAAEAAAEAESAGEAETASTEDASCGAPNADAPTRAGDRRG